MTEFVLELYRFKITMKYINRLNTKQSEKNVRCLEERTTGHRVRRFSDFARSSFSQEYCENCVRMVKRSSLKFTPRADKSSEFVEGAEVPD